jgi:hypothetical protein
MEKNKYSIPPPFYQKVSKESNKFFLPSAVRFYSTAVGNKLIGRNTSFSEEDLSTTEIDTLKRAIHNARADGRNHISYEDYSNDSQNAFDDKDNIFSETRSLFKNDAKNLALTLGQAKFDAEGNVYDKYDFAASPDRKITLKDSLKVITNPTSLAIPNFIGNLVGLKKGEGYPVKIKTGYKADPILEREVQKRQAIEQSRASLMRYQDQLHARKQNLADPRGDEWQKMEGGKTYNRFGDILSIK